MGMKPLTKAQRQGLRWLASRGADGVFNIYGVLVAMGETAPFTRMTWNSLERHGLAERYNPAKKGFGRLRLTTAGKCHPDAANAALDDVLPVVEKWEREDA